MRQRRQKREERAVRPVERGGRRGGAVLGAAKAVATVVIPGGRAVLGEGRPGIIPAPGFASALDSALGRGACLIGKEAIGAPASS